MTDFTKEELVLLAGWSVNRFDQVGIEQAKDEGTIALSHKIQDMIINYCEHANRDWDIKGNIFECGDCKQIVWDGGF